mmetsp:Transcript_45971/g.68409  ORF Transcript_45971/g.68409 Transcript_45971/m.68409 type:complete len:289 (-) Transcript_45971:137-1003(-)
MGLFDFITATAVSFVVGGNTGVSPFLTLFLVGIIEKSNPDMLNMTGGVETLLASWFSMLLLGGLTTAELLAKCIPVLDEIVDSVMTFIVPVMSIFGSMSTFGLFKMDTSGADAVMDEYGGDARMLADGSFITGTFLWFWQFMLICFGIILSLAMHAAKMLVRLIGVGWLTACITVLEATWVICTITIALFIRPISIVIAGVIVFSLGYQIKKKFIDKEDEEEQQAAGATAATGAVTGVGSGDGKPTEPDSDYVHIEDQPVMAEAVIVEGATPAETGAQKEGKTTSADV